MYHDFLLMAEDLDVDSKAMIELQSDAAPIVLLPKKKDPWSKIVMEAIAPRLNHVGAMMPYAPIFALLLNEFGKPIVATSGNLKGDPIEFQDTSAVNNLSGIVDVFIQNNREIVVPQDDSVIRFSFFKKQKIILRRSRGLAPN